MNKIFMEKVFNLKTTFSPQPKPCNIKFFSRKLKDRYNITSEFNNYLNNKKSVGILTTKNEENFLMSEKQDIGNETIILINKPKIQKDKIKLHNKTLNSVRNKEIFKTDNKESIIQKRYEFKDHIFEGTLINGLKEGFGRILYTSGKRKNGLFEGYFLNDKREGNGKMTYEDGFSFSGLYKNDLPNGEGVEIFPDGTKYKGNLTNGVKNGFGTMIWTSGERHEGNFENNTFNGQGTRYYINGDKYEGMWKDGYMDGKGIYYFSNGKRQEGLYERNKPKGLHLIYSKDGKIIKKIKNE